MEGTVYNVSWIVAQSMHSVAQYYGICDAAMPYVMTTVITMLLRGVAGLQSGDTLKCDNEFEALLAALPGDVRMRDMVLDALVQRARQGGMQQ